MNDIMQPEIEKIKRELLIRNYSGRTIKSYLFSLNKYFSWKKINPQKLDLDNIRDFLLYCQSNGVSAQTRNIFLSGIKFYYYNIIGSRIKINIKTAKEKHSLPVVLSQEEIARIITTIANTKHKLMIEIAYGGGLRVSEIINLRVKDIDLSGLTIHIKQSQGQKDRITLLSKKTVNNLQKLIVLKNADDFVFESERSGKLSTRTSQKIFENALQKSA